MAENGDALEFASIALRDDEEIVRAAIDSPLREFTWRIWHEHSLWQRQCSINTGPMVQRKGPLQFASARLRGLKGVVLPAVRREGMMLRYASAALKDDVDVVLAAVSQDGNAMEFVSEAMLDDREVLLAAVRTAGDVLQFASDRLRADGGVVRAAVAQSGVSLEDASDELAGDKEIVLTAVRCQPLALQFAMEALQADREVVLAAVGTGSLSALQFAHSSLRDDHAIVSAMIEGHFHRLREKQPFNGASIGADQQLRELRMHVGPKLKADKKLWQEVHEKLVIEEARQLKVPTLLSLAVAATATTLDHHVDPEAVRLSSAEVEQIKNAFFEYMLAKSSAPSEEAGGASDFKAEEGEYGEAATAEDARLAQELLAYDAMAEAVVVLEPVGAHVPAAVDAHVSAAVDAHVPAAVDAHVPAAVGAHVSAAVDAHVSVAAEGGPSAKSEAELPTNDAEQKAEGTQAADALGGVPKATVVTVDSLAMGKAWSEVASFKPCGLGLRALPQAVAHLTHLTLLWANDNELTTLPPLPPSLVELYLQRNALAELPATVIGALPRLRSLWLHENQLEHLPESLGSLDGLRDLIAFRNRIRSLPAALCGLRGLRELRLDENRLEALPPAIGELRSLEHLDVSNNRLSALPSSIGKLQTLSSLRVWLNRLSTFPAELCELCELMELSASQNEIVALPASFGALSERLVLNLVDNPMQMPPLAIAERGVGAIRRYFEALAKRESAVSRSGKLVLVGDGEVGKTSLLRLLQWRRAAPTLTEDRTVQLDMSTLGVRGKDAGVPVAGTAGDGEEAAAALFSCWDLSGQPEYAAAQQPFITCGPLFVLALPAHRCRDEEYPMVLGRWLDVLQASAPGAVVQPVVTQADRLLSLAELEAAVERHELRTTTCCVAGVPSAVAAEGRLFYEVTVHSKGSGCCVGFATPSFNAPDALHESLGNLPTSWCLNLANGKVRHRRREQYTKVQKVRAALCEWHDGDVIGLAVDFAVGELWIARNDEWFVAFTCDPSELVVDGGLYPALEGTGVVATVNCGAAPFVYGPPDARFYTAWEPTVPFGYCQQLRGKPEAFVLTALWRAAALQEAATEAVEWVLRRVAEHRSNYRRRCAGLEAPPAPLRVQRTVPVCSALPGGESTGDGVRAQLEAISCAVPPLLPSIGFTIPGAWLAPMAFVRALRDGTSPVEAAKRAAAGEAPLDPRVDGVPSKQRPYERVTTLRTLWEGVGSDALPAAHQYGAVDAQSVDDALGLLAAQGEVFISAGIAYLDPAYVAALMKPLVDHRLSSRSAALGFAASAAHGSALLEAVDQLVSAGILREELLSLLWSSIGLEAADYDSVLAMLEEAGVLFPAVAAADGASMPSTGEGSTGKRRWVMPMRLPKQPPVVIPSAWNHQLFRAQDGETAIGQALDLGSFVPPGLLERLMASAYSLGQHHYFWRRPHGAGALIRVELNTGSEGRGAAARLLLDVDDLELEVANETGAGGASSPCSRKYVLRFEVFAQQAHAAEAGRLLAKAKELMEHLLRDFPGMVASPLYGAARWRRVGGTPRTERGE